jgi:glycosyltransferase involved in cell wall biosynthesis
MNIRVLHCIHSLSGGGAERQLGIIANHASSVGIVTGIFCVNAEHHEIESVDCDLFELKDSSKYPFGLISEIRGAIDDFKPDIVHCWLPVPVILPAMIISKWRRIPVVASYRVNKTFKFKYSYLEYLAVKFLASAIVSNTLPSQSDPAWEKLFYSKLNAYIPNAVVSEQPEQAFCSERTVHDKTIILFVGRISDAQKNWRCLLNAVSKLDRPDKWHLQICGKGLAAEEKALAVETERLGLADQVEILGFRKDVRNVMSRADVMVLPSWYEGMPNVVLEAMNAGLPCIVSDIPAHADLFGDEAGVKYFDPASPDQLADILSAMIDGRVDLKVMAQRGKEYAERFSPRVMMQRYRDLYHRLISSQK